MAQRIIKDHTRNLREPRPRPPQWAQEAEVVCLPPSPNKPRYPSPSREPYQVDSPTGQPPRGPVYPAGQRVPSEAQVPLTSPLNRPLAPAGTRQHIVLASATPLSGGPLWPAGNRQHIVADAPLVAPA